MSAKPIPDFKMAAIDLGSNAVRLEIGRLKPGRVIEILCDEREPARLGADVFRTGELSETARDRVLEAMARFATLIRRFKPDVTRCVATSAMREASNYDEFVRTVKARTGLVIDVISGGEEARLLCLGALGGLASGERESMVIDVGGGSTEVAVARGSEVMRAKSLPLGTVRLTEVFLKSDPARRKQLRLLREYIQEILRSRLEKDLIRRFRVSLACAGTAGAAAAMIHGEKAEGTATPHVTYDQMRELLERIGEMTSSDRARLPGCDPSRADVIVAGVAILVELMRHLELEELEISRRGIRDGLMVDILRRQGLWDAQDPDQALYDAIETLGRRCGFDYGHARQVTRLAEKMFDTLVDRVVPAGRKSQAAATARRILIAASMLHDIGVFVSYARHHKHSAYLIANAEIPGLTELEKALASNVARYHRRAHPRDRHPEFVVLQGEHRELVRKLAAILRIADGLDRTHDARVKGVIIRAKKKQLVIRVESSKDLELELWAVRQKATLFKEAFGIDLIFKAAEPPIKAVTARMTPKITKPRRAS